MTIVPPLPLSVAFAWIKAKSATDVFRACMNVGFEFCQDPPIRISPPPNNPLANVCEPLFRLIVSANNKIWPPCFTNCDALLPAFNKPF